MGMVIFLKCLVFHPSELSVMTMLPYIKPLKIDMCVMIERHRILQYFLNYQRYFDVFGMVFLDFIMCSVMSYSL